MKTRIQQERERAVLNRSELARAAGITYKTLLLIETGRVQPRTQTLRAIAAALGVEARTLLD